MNLLNNKNILFIGPNFYNYHTYIIQSLEKKGANVTFFSDKTSSTPYAIATKISHGLKIFVGNLYVKYQLKTIENKKFDFVFFIRGELFDIETLSFIKSINPNTKFIMYQWDSIKNYPHYLLISDLFNKKFSFDKKDCQEYKTLQYMPTFYPDIIDRFSNQVKNKKRQKTIDLLFIGSDLGDRYEILKHFQKSCDKNHLNCKFFLYTKARWWLKKKLTNSMYRSSKTSEFIFKFLSYQKVLDLIIQSKIVIDINSVNQQGITLRTYEALALNSKLLTTNESIIEEKFFTPDMIKVFDRKEPSFNLDFLHAPTVNMNISSYSLSNWIDQLFSNNDTLETKEKDANE